jgi:hypothetical protein
MTPAEVLQEIMSAIPEEYGAGNMPEMIRQMARDLAEAREENARLQMLAQSMHVGREGLPEWAALRVAAMVRP